MRYRVFGSNLSGHHGKGAALAAKRRWGAKQGVGFGPQGQSFAIPTKGLRQPNGTYPVLPLEDIGFSVKLFLIYATDHLQDTFVVTRIGCGLAGYRDDQMAPLFADAPENCEFDPVWARWGLKTWKEAP